MNGKDTDGVPTTFLQKTFEMISDTTYSDTVCWSQDGKSFLIKNSKAFSEEVLPKYFKHNNLASFVRQLNMYDFHKRRCKNQFHVFEHPFFVRERYDLLGVIRRKPAYPLVSKSRKSDPELSPILQKLSALNKTSKDYDSKILEIEDRVKSIGQESKTLLSEVWDSKERIKNVEGILQVVAKFLESEPANQRIQRPSESSSSDLEEKLCPFGTQNHYS